MTFLAIHDSCLLVVDMQCDFYGPERDDVDRDVLDSVFRTGAWVAAVAAALGVPTVVTEEDADTNGPTTAVVTERLHESAQVLPKRAFAAPDNPQILAAIESTGAPATVLVGMETDVCVAHSALRLQALGKRVVAVHDALYSPGAAHANGLGRMRAAGVELLSAKELLYDWLPTLDEIRAFRRKHPALSTPPGFSL